MCMVHNVLKCMTSAAAMAYVTLTGARVFAELIACTIKLAFIIVAIRTFAIARKSYPKAQVTF